MINAVLKQLFKIRITTLCPFGSFAVASDNLPSELPTVVDIAQYNLNNRDSFFESLQELHRGHKYV